MSTRSLVRRAFRIASWIVLAAVTAGGVWAFVRTWQRVSQPAPEIVQGQIEATEIDVSSKIPGRLAGISVVEGASVSKGELVATLDSPEIEAKLAQARAAKAAASAQRDKANRGAREEEIRAAEANWRRAREAANWLRRRFTASIAWRGTAWRLSSAATKRKPSGSRLAKPRRPRRP